jgi:DNA primase
MGKISPVSSKYVINASINIEGVVDRPDVIGAIFGQTEGLLGADLELRELQRSGRIGRIEVIVATKSGKTQGTITIPSSLDKAETAIVGASLEIIKRIGPCNAKIQVKNIEDVRVSKRDFVVSRAKQLLKSLMENVMPDSQELAEEVAHSVRVMEITTYGRDRLAAGPNIDESEEIIVVEGRADVMNLLKYGFKNVIALNGTSVPPSVIALSKEKSMVVFVDGDRGGRLIIKELAGVADLDFVCIAPDGKEVEELAGKEIHKALRSRIATAQALLEMKDTSTHIRKPLKKDRGGRNDRNNRNERNDRNADRKIARPAAKKAKGLSVDEKKKFGEILEGLVGTRGACLIDEKMKIMGKVPYSELVNTLASLKSGVYCIVFDGVADKKVVEAAEKSRVQHMIAMDSNVKDARSVNVVTAAQL